MNNGEVVSRAVNSLKLTTKDSHISRRYILRTLRGIAKSLISQKILDRSLSYDYNIYTSIECFELEKEDIFSCPIIAFKRCNTLMKSKKKLPELVHSRIGASIKNVTSLDGMKNFTVLDANQYRRNNNRKYSLKDENYIYTDSSRYLYIPDDNILAVNIEVITLLTELADECSECKKANCKSYWDYEFICPDRLLETVLRDGLQIIATMYGATIKDSNPNGIDKQPTQ